MHKIQVILLIILSMLMMSACSSTSYLSQPASEDFRIDGMRTEWTGKFQIPDGEKFALGISNDANYLYVAISSIDRGFQRQLAVGGLTIWLDVKGGKRENLGIRFKGKMPQRDQKARSGRQRADEWNPLGERLFDGDLGLIVIDIKAGKRLGPADLLATSSSQDESLFMEYQIPLILLGDDFDPTRNLGFGIESTIERPEMAAGHAGGMAGGRGEMSGDRSSRAGGGRQGGGSRSGAPGGSTMGQSDLELWMKVQLTSQ